MRTYCFTFHEMPSCVRERGLCSCVGYLLPLGHLNKNPSLIGSHWFGYLLIYCGFKSPLNHHFKAQTLVLLYFTAAPRAHCTHVAGPLCASHHK